MTSFLKFALCLSVVISNISSIVLANAQSKGERPCGNRWYNPTEAFCCDEKVHRINKNVSSGPNDCCNGSPYNRFTHACCAGCLHARNDNQLMCCGKTPYSQRTHMCCGGRVSKNDDCLIRCCGGKLYTTETRICCGGVTYPIKQGQDCCGSSVYNTSSEICCNGCINTRNYHHIYIKCCNKIAYNIKTHSCCGEVIYDFKQSRNRRCCNAKMLFQRFGGYSHCCESGDGEGTLFDFRVSRCCDGIVVVNPSGKKLAVDTRCCSNLLYRPDMYTGCCGHVIYNPVTHACCQGTKGSSVNQKERNHKCCNGQYYDSTKAKCCCGKVVYTGDLAGTECCGEKLFKSPGVCCQNNWFSRPYTRCCGPNPLKGDWWCCDFKKGIAYFPRRHACCGGLVVNAGKLLPKSQSYDCCGGTTAYNRLESICCCGCIHPRKPNIACCGPRAHDQSSTTCCEFTGAILPRSEFDHCCVGLFPYSSKTHHCCRFEGRRVISHAESCFD